MTQDLAKLRKALYLKGEIKKIELKEIIIAEDVTIGDEFIIPLAVIKGKKINIIACKSTDIKPGFNSIKLVSAFQIKSMTNTLNGEKNNTLIYSKPKYNNFGHTSNSKW